jgi:hypothetical protein
LAGHSTDFFSAARELAYALLSNCPYNFSIIGLKFWRNKTDNKKSGLKEHNREKEAQQKEAKMWNQRFF